MRHAAALQSLSAAVAVLAAACTGTLGDELTGGRPGPTGPGAEDAGGEGGAAPNPGVPPNQRTAADARVRRLTAREYNASVLDVFGDATQPARSFPVDPTQTGFDNDFANLSMSDLFVETAQSVAETVAAGVVTRLATLLPCTKSTPLDETTCAGQFIDAYGRRLFRRPVQTDERARYVALFSKARSITDFPGSIQTLVESMLQSPSFLLRNELGPTGQTGIVRLDPYQLASEISFFLWGSGPDDALLDAAASGALNDAAGVDAQVQRLLQDDRSKRAADGFFTQWLDIDDPSAISKSNTVFPTFNANVAASMTGETRAFIADVLANRDATLTTLLTSNKTFANADVAAIYGITGPTGAGFVPVTLDPAQRAGFLTQPGVIAAHTPPDQTSPILTGKFVREKLFCQQLVVPNVIPKLPDPAQGITTRARFAGHDVGGCKSCHSLMDDIGWGYEQFDPIGRFQATDPEVPSDVLTGVGTLSGTDVDGDFTGPVALATKLAASAEVKSCFAQTGFGYALGRLTQSQDAPVIQGATQTFVSANSNVKTLMRAIANSDAFLYRIAASTGGK